jgi:hypothetical protein
MTLEKLAVVVVPEFRMFFTSHFPNYFDISFQLWHVFAFYCAPDRRLEFMTQRRVLIVKKERKKKSVPYSSGIEKN